MPAQVTEETDDTPSAEPSLHKLLEQMSGGGGWPDLEAKNLGDLLKKQIDQQRQQMRKEAIVFREAFATEAGRRVLELLLNNTLRRTAWPVHAMQDAEMLMAHGIWREAENSFVAAIIEAIAFADNQDIQPRSEP